TPILHWSFRCASSLLILAALSNRVFGFVKTLKFIPSGAISLFGDQQTHRHSVSLRARFIVTPTARLQNIRDFPLPVYQRSARSRMERTQSVNHEKHPRFRFGVNSQNYRQESAGTSARIAEYGRLLGRV